MTDCSSSMYEDDDGFVVVTCTAHGELMQVPSWEDAADVWGDHRHAIGLHQGATQVLAAYQSALERATTMPVGVFTRSPYARFRQVADGGWIVVTRHGHPLAVVRPYPTEPT